MQDEKIPLIDCPIDYIFGEASGKILNEYGNLSLKNNKVIYEGVCICRRFCYGMQKKKSRILT